jgi:hypothetical protein
VPTGQLIQGEVIRPELSKACALSQSFPIKEKLFSLISNVKLKYEYLENSSSAETNWERESLCRVEIRSEVVALCAYGFFSCTSLRMVIIHAHCRIRAGKTFEIFIHFSFMKPLV